MELIWLNYYYLVYFCSTSCIALMISSIFPFHTCLSFFSLSFRLSLSSSFCVSFFSYNFFSPWSVVLPRFRCICAECISCKCAMNDWWIYEGKNERNNTIYSATKKIIRWSKRNILMVLKPTYFTILVRCDIFQCHFILYSGWAQFLLYFHVFRHYFLRLEHEFPSKWQTERDQK